MRECVLRGYVGGCETEYIELVRERSVRGCGEGV